MSRLWPIINERKSNKQKVNQNTYLMTIETYHYQSNYQSLLQYSHTHTHTHTHFFRSEGRNALIKQ